MLLQVPNVTGLGGLIGAVHAGTAGTSCMHQSYSQLNYTSDHSLRLASMSVTHHTRSDASGLSLFTPCLPKNKCMLLL